MNKLSLDQIKTTLVRFRVSHSGNVYDPYFPSSVSKTVHDMKKHYMNKSVNEIYSEINAIIKFPYVRGQVSDIRLEHTNKFLTLIKHDVLGK